MQSFDYDAMPSSSSTSRSWFERRPRQRRDDEFGATGLTRPAKLALLSCMAVVGLVMIIVGVVCGSTGSVAAHHATAPPLVNRSDFKPTALPTLKPTGPTLQPTSPQPTLFKPTPRPTRAPAPRPTLPARDPHTGACATAWCEARGFGPDSNSCGCCESLKIFAVCICTNADKSCTDYDGP